MELYVKAMILLQVCRSIINFCDLMASASSPIYGEGASIEEDFKYFILCLMNFLLAVWGVATLV